LETILEQPRRANGVFVDKLQQLQAREDSSRLWTQVRTAIGLDALSDIRDGSPEPGIVSLDAGTSSGRNAE
jgi:hypothetical protein